MMIAGIALEHLQDLGYHTALIRVDGLSSSTNNARQIRDAVVAMDLAPDERLVLVGYSKGTPDILEGLVTYPELAQRVAAVVSVAGAVNGSPLADDASPSMLTLLKTSTPVVNHRTRGMSSGSQSLSPPLSAGTPRTM